MKKTLLVVALMFATNFTLWAQHRNSNAMGLSEVRTEAPTALPVHTLKKTYLSVGGSTGPNHRHPNGKLPWNRWHLRYSGGPVGSDTGRFR